MDTTASLAVLAGTCGVIMGASPLLQALRAHQRRSSADVSMPFLGLLWVGNGAWLAYAIALSNIAMIVANTVGVIAVTTAIAVSHHWREGKQHRDG
ncbi:MAG: SemiSWEET family transporter [Actinomycetota bacterium]